MQDDLLAVLRVRRSTLSIHFVDTSHQSSVPSSANEELLVDLRDCEPICRTVTCILRIFADSVPREYVVDLLETRGQGWRRSRIPVFSHYATKQRCLQLAS